MVQYFNGLINLDCGKDPYTFNEKKLLNELPGIKYDDFQGTTWAPSLIPLKTWKKVDGFSEEYTFGLGSDPDFNMKLWEKGVRIFKGLGNCRVYHFSSETLRKKTRNDGSKIFLKKWEKRLPEYPEYFLTIKKLSITLYQLDGRAIPENISPRTVIQARPKRGLVLQSDGLYRVSQKKHVLLKMSAFHFPIS